MLISGKDGVRGNYDLGRQIGEAGWHFCFSTLYRTWEGHRNDVRIFFTKRSRCVFSLSLETNFFRGQNSPNFWLAYASAAPSHLCLSLPFCGLQINGQRYYSAEMARSYDWRTTTRCGTFTRGLSCPTTKACALVTAPSTSVQGGVCLPTTYLGGSWYQYKHVSVWGILLINLPGSRSESPSEIGILVL